MTIQETAALLQTMDRVLLLTHVRPDGDTIGSAAALCRALRDLGREDRRTVRWLAALLRVADGLDVEHRGQVTGLSCGLGDGTVEVIVRAAASPRAALEAAARKADLFREISGRNLVMQWKP